MKDEDEDKKKKKGIVVVIALGQKPPKSPEHTADVDKDEKKKGWETPQGDIPRTFPTAPSSQGALDFGAYKDPQDERPTLQCPECEFTTQDPIAYMRHKQTAHPSDDININ